MLHKIFGTFLSCSIYVESTEKTIVPRSLNIIITSCVLKTNFLGDKYVWLIFLMITLKATDKSGRSTTQLRNL